MLLVATSFIELVHIKKKQKVHLIIYHFLFILSLLYRKHYKTLLLNIVQFQKVFILIEKVFNTLFTP